MRSVRIAPWALLAVCPFGPLRPAIAATMDQAGRVVAHSTALSAGEAQLELELADGRTVSIVFEEGAVLIGGDEVATYRPGGALVAAWRALVIQAAELPPEEILGRVRALDVAELTEQETAALRLVRQALNGLFVSPSARSPALAGAAGPPQAPGEPGSPVIAPVQIQVDLDDLLQRRHVYRHDHEVPAGEVIDGAVTMLRGDLTVAGSIKGDVTALEGDVILVEGGVIEGDVRLLRGELVRDGGRVLGRVEQMGATVMPEIPAPPPSRFVPPGSPSVVGRIATQVLSLLATFVALLFMGIGLMFFVPRQLEAVADTVWHSFGRSFLAGLFAQPLVIPALAILVMGLTITIVGALLVPFAVAALAVTLFLAVVGGYIAVARTVGEVYLRRRVAYGLQVRGWLTYRYLVYGLIGLLAMWLPAVFLGWIPVAGTIMTVSAALSTWVLATAGFGAALLSRGGIRGTVVRRIDRALADERFWEPSSHRFEPPARLRRGSSP